MRNIRLFLGIIILVVVLAIGLNLWKQKTYRQDGVDKSNIELPGSKIVSSEEPKDVTKKEPKGFDMELLFSPTPIEESMVYQVQPGDTLSSIAKKFGTTIDLIKASNKLQGSIIKAGKRLKIIQGEFKIVVDTSNNTLSLFLNDKRIKTYPVSTAKYKNTPIGEFKIINRIINPIWYSDEGVYPYGDPKNVLGTRWMGINEPSYGIHGTTDPESIGKYVSQGCIRMHNRDVEELFKIVPVGTKVNIIKGKEG